MNRTDIEHYITYYIPIVGYMSFGFLFYIITEIKKTIFCWEFVGAVIFLIGSSYFFGKMVNYIEVTRRNPKQRSKE